MNFLLFKNLKFFKNKEVSKKKPLNKPTNEKRKNKYGFWKKSLQNPFIYLFLFVAFLSYFLSYLPSKSLPQLTVEEIASSDIIAPRDLTIIDNETTESRKKEAVEAVLPVYSFNQNASLNTEEKIRSFFRSGRELLNKAPTSKRVEEFKKQIFENFGIEISMADLRSLIKAKYSTGLEENLISLIGKISAQGIILSKNLFIHSEQERGLTLINSPKGEKIVKISDILDITESKERLTEEINNLDLPQSEKSLLIALSHLFITGNITYNKMETDARKELARTKIEPVFYTIKKGKVIIRKGDEVSKDVLKQIAIINQNLREKPSWLTNFAGTFLLFGLLFVTLWYYLKSISKEPFKNFLLMGLILVISFLFYKLSLFLSGTFSQSTNLPLLKYRETYEFAFPFQFGTILFAFLTRIHIALVYTIMNSLLVGYLFKSNFNLMFFCLIGGFAAIYGIKYYGKQKRTAIFRAGLFLISPIYTLVIIIFHLIKENMGPLAYFSSELIMGVLGGILSAALAFLFLPVIENLFSFTTQTKLFELTNSDLPIFREMAIEAPGSYHHSLVVASLAETAAEKIFLDPMLVKAGALYHDIGKIKRPEYFAENRSHSSDMHKDLKPSMSTLVIVNHVKEGMEIAKRQKLPKRIVEIIEQHHGDSLVKYFFEKAKEEYDPEMQKIGEESYRYAGPKPKSKEAALVMLADSVEAASRSLKSPSKTNLKRVITDIFNNYVQDGQLDDCNFSLKELRAIASSFLTTLDTIYHHRVAYPGFDFEKKKTSKRNTSNDRNH